MKYNKWMSAAVLAASVAALAGCSSSPSRISDDGKSDEIVFPDVAKDAWLKEGTFPQTEDLRLVMLGMTKEQIYALLGRPHFREGISGVHEWDYVFHFSNDGGKVDTCQYKLIFGSDYHVRSTHWKPQRCAAYLKPPAPAPVAPVKTAVQAENKRIRLGADGLFAYKRSAIADLLPGGMDKLNAVAADLLSGGQIEEIRVVGHADRLGGGEYNLRLSQARAATVRAYLVGKGVPAERISASGEGSTHPVVECNDKDRSALIRCLAPNRRVEITAWILRKT